MMEKVTDKKAILQMFVSLENERPALMHPTRHDGYLFASNGRILVCVADDPSLEAKGSFDPERFTSIFHKYHEVGLFQPLNVLLPDPTVCESCHGRKRLQRCDCCEGEGTFRHRGHDYDCKPCEGNGVYANDLVETDALDVVCFACEGAGQKLDIPISLHGKTFRRYYLEILMQLEGIELQADEPADKLSISFFRFHGGRGAIMPMRY
jgi:hypothetical protein